MEFKQIIVTSEIAKMFLEKTKINRKPKKVKIMSYINDINNNRWVNDTGETIKFDTNGNLIDGQNRLYAIIETNKEQLCYIATNCSLDAQKVIDGGNRNLRDAFLVHQVNEYSAVSIMVKNLYNKLMNKNIDNAQRRYFTTMEYVNFYNENKDFIDNNVKVLKEFAYQRNKISVFKPFQILGFGAYLLYLGAEYESVSNFLDFMITGNDIPLDNIRYQWNILLQKKRKNQTIPNRIIDEILTKSWNAYITNDTKKIILNNQKTEVII